MITKKTGVIVACAAVVLVAAVGGATALERRSHDPVPAAARDLGPPIASVNGQLVYLDEMRSRVQGIELVHGTLRASLGPNWREELLQNLVDDKIVLQKADELGIVVTDAEVQAHLDEIRGMFPDQASFDQWLAQGQMDQAELFDRIRLQTVASLLYRKVTKGVPVSLDRARAYYDAHPDKYPGVDGNGAPFLAVKDQIKRDVAKKLRDRAYAAWLADQRKNADVVVLMDDWWKEIA
jgi:parvulin-like peptidyl-prolyl isomerase